MRVGNVYEGLAKGYATEYVQKKADHSCIQDWIESPQKTQAFNKFVLASQMENEGRILEQMAPLIHPPFSKPFIPYPWSKNFKSVSAQLVSAAPETDVFEVSDDDRAQYSERSVFLNNLLYVATQKELDATMHTVANMSHHTIMRLLQRGVASKDTLEEQVGVVMSVARDLAHIFQWASMSQRESHDFMIPYSGGALAMRTLKVRPMVKSPYHDDHWVFSVRTFLDRSMLKPADHERMAGLEVSKEGHMTLSWLGQSRQMRRGLLKEADVNHLKGWLKANARPSKSRQVVSDDTDQF